MSQVLKYPLGLKAGRVLHKTGLKPVVKTESCGGLSTRRLSSPPGGAGTGGEGGGSAPGTGGEL